MDYCAIFRSDREKPVVFLPEDNTTKDIIEKLNSLEEGIQYRAEPRSLNEVEQQKGGKRK